MCGWCVCKICVNIWKGWGRVRLSHGQGKRALVIHVQCITVASLSIVNVISSPSLLGCRVTAWARCGSRRKHISLCLLRLEWCGNHWCNTKNNWFLSRLTQCNPLAKYSWIYFGYLDQNALWDLFCFLATTTCFIKSYFLHYSPSDVRVILKIVQFYLNFPKCTVGSEGFQT